jgi:hypothetical protein
MAPMGYSAALGKLIHEKTWSQKSPVRFPLRIGVGNYVDSVSESEHIRKANARCL